MKHPNYARALEWGKLITITGSAQIVVQAISFLCGILVIRLLPTQEYALYTLANTMLGTMVLLADGGISTGVLAQGGKVWQDRERLGTVLVTGLDLRKKFAIGSLLIASPILLWLLRHHGASWLMSVLLLLATIPTFLTGLSNTLLETAPKLRQDIAPLQKNQVGVNIGRLALLVLTIFIFPWAFVAILAAGLPQIWGNFRLKKISAGYADLTQKPDPEIRAAILKVVKRVLPGAVYYSASGQITVWLMSVFGTTAAIAQIGALSRLSTMLSLFTMLLMTLVIPRFARLSAGKAVLLTRYFQIQAGLLVLSIFIVGTVWMFPTQVLWILGKNYSGLNIELVLSIIGSCLNLITGISFSLVSSRGWATNPAITISLEIAAVIIGIMLIDVSTLKGALILNIFISIMQALLYIIYGTLKITKSEEVEVAS
ncbi:lipopolysaccharide biosynthesis protein [Hymenobacter volaticus]|uniref:Polysaccharide biosynthesis protein n=1 Tax=Hymenobacter volaticus TaxID=2932254 RepID=A0ABY4G838_9BACT|nr:polysaccharide biosynthesis protein [Hymenobacter volaticus]UOQ67073.1 polysaccharide biosynthesis protein [Hymenobacter volaticus]